MTTDIYIVRIWLESTQAGVNPKIVSERLGHSSVRITLDIYSHVLPGMQDEAASKLDEMLTFQRPEAVPTVIN